MIKRLPFLLMMTSVLFAVPVPADPVGEAEAAIEALEISEDHLYDILAARDLYRSLTEEDRKKVSNAEKIEEAGTFLYECYMQELRDMVGLVKDGRKAMTAREKDGLTGRRALSEAMKMADDLVRCGFKFDEEDRQRLGEESEKLLDLCYPGTGILKLEYVTGTSLEESGSALDDSEFAGCYHHAYMIDAAEHGDEEQGIAFCQFCLEDYTEYLQEHFEYVNSGVTENDYDYDHFRDDMGNDIYLSHYVFELHGPEVEKCYVTFISIDYSKAIPDGSLHDYQGDTLLGSTPIRYAKKGDLIRLGRYEQDNYTADGPEQIYWRVLDAGDDAILVISDKILDCVPGSTGRTGTAWETGTVRQWLDSDFIKTAFTEGEQTVLKSVEIPGPDDLDGESGDATDIESMSSEPTPYALAMGVDPKKDLNIDAAGSGIRPALWLSRMYEDEDLEVDEEQFIPETEAVFEDPTVYTDPEIVKAAQTALNEAGFDCGRPDGKAGKLTRGGVTKYQEANGLEVTGNIDGTLLHSLGLLE